MFCQFNIPLIQPFFSTSISNCFISSICKLKNHSISLVLTKFIINFMFFSIWSAYHVNTIFRTWKNTEITVHTFRHINCKTTYNHFFLRVVGCHSTINLTSLRWFNRINFYAIYRAGSLTLHAGNTIINIYVEA